MPPLVRQLEQLLHPPFRRCDWEALASAALHVRIGSDAPAVGRARSLDVLEAALADFEFRPERFCHLWQADDVLLAETEVCPREDPGHPAPCFLVVRLREGRLLDVRAYVDRHSQ